MPTSWLTVAATAFGYVFIGVVVYRVMAGQEGDDAAFAMALMWPMPLALFVVSVPILAACAVSWGITEVPVWIAKRVREERQMRQAARARKLREARAILAEEGLDFDP